ncbi:MAG TPA: hypothetical protein PKC43_07290 [Phycisphaerales bacterium]|nr:hypothetical protein [Phycisphaerales bacterium]
MLIASALIALAALVTFGIALYGLFAERRSAALGATASVIAVVALICAWHAWAETRSIPWSVGYGTAAAASLAAAIRQFIG